jgi:hypothetical protein
MSRVTQQPKLVGETRTYYFDFTSLLGSLETISTVTCAASVYSGTDASPSSIISGAASGTGTQIAQQNITGGVVGTIYEVKCTVSTSLFQTLVMTCFLPVIQDLA